MIDKMWAILTTFTDEAQQAALAKCKELGLDQTRGVVSLDESYINLSSARNVLTDAIEKKKLIQLPITIQKDLVAALEMIATRQTALANGSDEVVNLTDAIEKLNTYIWQYGLHNLSGEVLGYQEKLNQLKAMELAATETTRKLQEGIQVKDQLDQILTNATAQSTTLQEHVASAATSLTATNASLADTQEATRQATESLGAIQQTQTAATALLGTSTTSNTAILAFETHINELVSGFTTLKGDLEGNKTKQEKLFADLDAHRKTIKGLLDDANRTGMAASFTNRRRWLVVPMLIWILVFAVSIAGLYYMGDKHIASIISSSDWTQLPARLALTAPFIWLGWFSAKQYGYMSRLREDYAYKEASAKSFEGYKREAGELDQAMLKNLLETAIKNLGDNPIRIYSGHDNHASPLQELLEKSLKDPSAMELLKALVAKAKG